LKENFNFVKMTKNFYKIENFSCFNMAFPFLSRTKCVNVPKIFGTKEETKHICQA